MSTKMSDEDLSGAEEIPDDFFDEFDDNKFLDEIVENVVPEHTSNDSTDVKSNNVEQENDEEPMVKRCLLEIDKLTKSIQRRKRRLREGSERSKRNSKNRSRSKSPSTSRGKKVKSRERARSTDRHSAPRRSPVPPRYRSRGRSRSRSRERRRSSRSRRDMRSRSNSPTGQPRTMSFLEELAHKFAQKGQEFPEKNLLLQLQGKHVETSLMPSYPMNMTYQQCDVAPSIPPYMQMPMYNQPTYQPPWNGNYMHHPMNALPHPMQTISLPSSTVTNSVIPTATINPSRGRLFWNAPTDKAEAVAKCRNASKILRSEENKVPKLRFLFTRTSMPIPPNEEKTPSLQSRKNVQFEQTSDNLQSLAPLQFLLPRTRELVKSLGFNCTHIISRLRLKQFADQMLHDIEDMDAAKRKAKDKSLTDCGIQTESYKCPSCVNREMKTFANKSVQVDGPKKVSIRIQTNERDYREPLIRSLSRLTSGQLVAASDFVKLICEPRPSTNADIVKVREQLMDIYNLSERGTEAIEAEWEREQEMRHRSMMSNSGGPQIDDLRNTLRGSSENNMGRIPPPPPLLMNYHFNDEEIAMRRAEEEEERERVRRQQIRFEEERRFEEQRIREMEWEREQQILQQQQIQQQQQLQIQMQLQLQREKEQEAMLEMRERKRIGRGRGSHWSGGGRGRGRY